MIPVKIGAANKPLLLALVLLSAIVHFQQSFLRFVNQKILNLVSAALPHCAFRFGSHAATRILAK